MISFVIIGRNIKNTFELCVGSVLKFISINDIKANEIIYVDSDSNDSTLEIAKKFPIRIFLITGNINAAIARNVGAQNAKGDILFFLDGDMELLPHFFDFIFNKITQSLKYPFARGYMKEKYYDSCFKYLYTLDEIMAKEPLHEHVTGGLMIVEKNFWEDLGGMDERLIRNQDLDFGLRMSKNGFPVLKDNHFWIIHHTTSYYDKSRFASFIKSKALLSSGILMRKHLFDFNYIKYFRRNVFYNSLLFISIIILFINPMHSFLIFLFYLAMQLTRSLFLINKSKHLVNSFIFNTTINIYSLMGFLFYYPARPLFKLYIIK